MIGITLSQLVPLVYARGVQGVYQPKIPLSSEPGSPSAKERQKIFCGNFWDFTVIKNWI